LLAAFDGVCRRRGLGYFAGGGTLLGAVRHGGYIPWDDDIDLFMLREDYDRLLTWGEDFAAPFFLQTAYNDVDYGRGHAQLRMDGTTAVLAGERGHYRFHQGIFIDVFPLDFVPDDPDAQAAQRRRLARWNKWLAATVRYPGRPHKTPVKTALHKMLSPVSYRWIYGKMEQECRRYSHTSRVALLSFEPQSDRWVLPAAAFAGAVYWPFEHTKIPIPVGFDEVLTVAYGDWRIPRQEPTYHEGILFDPHRDWREYVK
jgi:lipopolysaccharide cholinephosphotransferase